MYLYSTLYRLQNYKINSDYVNALYISIGSVLAYVFCCLISVIRISAKSCIGAPLLRKVFTQTSYVLYL